MAIRTWSFERLKTVSNACCVVTTLKTNMKSETFCARSNSTSTWRTVSTGRRQEFPYELTHISSPNAIRPWSDSRTSVTGVGTGFPLATRRPSRRRELSAGVARGPVSARGQRKTRTVCPRNARLSDRHLATTAYDSRRRHRDDQRRPDLIGPVFDGRRRVSTRPNSDAPATASCVTPRSPARRSGARLRRPRPLSR